jgi:hypothetical protein
MNPAFGPAQVRALTELFLEKAEQLRGKLMDEINKSEASQGGKVPIDVLSWLSRATLDIIGHAGKLCIVTHAHYNHYNINVINRLWLQFRFRRERQA